MRLYNKRVIKQNNRVLNEASTVKNWRDTSFLSMAIYKKENGRGYLYPIPNRNINNLDYDNGKRVMKNDTVAPLKIATFLYTRAALKEIESLDGVGLLEKGILVLINYFDFDIMDTYNQYFNTVDLDERNKASRYNSTRSAEHTDRTCIITAVISEKSGSTLI